MQSERPPQQLTEEKEPPVRYQKRIYLFFTIRNFTVSPSLLTLASPLLHAATAVSSAVVTGAEGAFEKLLAAGESAPGAELAGIDDGSIPALELQADTLLAEIKSRSLARLAEAGVSLNGPLALENDALGDLQVATDHPQAAAIERALAGDRDLRKLVEELQTVNRRLARERQAEASDRLFALDPNFARNALDEPSELDEPVLRVTLRPRELEFNL